MVDWVDRAITVGLAVAGYGLAHVFTSIRQGKDIEQLGVTQLQQGKRIDNHDEQFRKLNSDFVPRLEITESMETIKKSQARTERWLEWIMFGRKGTPPAMGDEPH